MTDEYLGTLFIVAAPSGGGKTSLVKKLIQDLNDIEVSVSHTTRPQRPAEKHEKDYFFISQNEFQAMVHQNEFVEHAEVFDYSYGTSKSQILERLKSGIDVVLDIDWQGAQQIKKSFDDAVGIFIIPPSLEALKQRLCERQQDAQEVIQNRMKKAQDELSHYHEFDYLIVNDDFQTAAQQLQSIIVAHRLKIERQSKVQKKLLSFLLSSK